MCEHLLDVSKTLGIRKLCIAGDFLNADAYSHFDKLIPKEFTDWGTELEVGGRVVEALLDWFTDIVMLPGNHEERFLRANNWECSFEHMIRLFGLPEGLRSRIVVNVGPHTRSAYRYAVFCGYRVTHAKNFSIIPARVAFRLASKYEQHIICAHGHRVAKTMSESGKYVVIDSGGMFDKKRMAYTSIYDTTYPEQTNGFIVLRKGKSHVFGDETFTDWDFWRSLPAASLRRAARG